MIGTKRQRKRGVWEISVEHGRDALGKRRRRSRTVHGTKADADRTQREMVAEAERVRTQDPSDTETRVLIADWVRDWLKSPAMSEKAITTLERYADNAERHVLPYAGAIPLRDLSLRHIREMERGMLEGRLSGRPVGNRSLQIAHRILAGACEMAVEMEHLDRNLMSSVRAPRCRSDEVIPPEAKVVQQLLKLARREAHRLFAYIYLLTYTGLRRGEGMALTWENVNLDLGNIFVAATVVKTKKGLMSQRPKTRRAVRTIDLDPGTIEVLKEHRARQIELGISGGRNGLVFPDGLGEWMKPTTMDRDLKQLASRVGAVGLTFHCFRHFHATMLLQAGQSVVVVSQRLGHADPSITLRIYGHVLTGWQKGAAQAFAEAMEDAA
ncbi:MAG: tyrosine-type recombinase/integrase [Chloroflexi bacterium]|nr:tyrosine-type recombinase/integrase [Chloroflexota bacterium]